MRLILVHAVLVRYCSSIRLSSVFKIKSSARFSDVSPTWLALFHPRRALVAARNMRASVVAEQRATAAEQPATPVTAAEQEQPATAAGEQPATAAATKQLSPAASAFRPAFRAAAAHAAMSSTCCARLHGGGRASAAAVLMPWLGFGTYKLGARHAKQAVLAALHAGYRMIDTAYIYSNERTEREVGAALSHAIAEGVVQRADVFVTTKHWLGLGLGLGLGLALGLGLGLGLGYPDPNPNPNLRRKYHGFEPALGCLQRSLERLQLDFVDCWMMHWPGPAWEARGRPGRRCSEARAAPSEDAHDEPPSRAPSAGCPPSSGHAEPALHGPCHEP